MGSGGSVVAVSEYMGGKHGSGILYTACDVIGMSVVRGVCGVYDLCMCLARGGVGDVGVRRLSFGFISPGGRGGKWDMCLCLL